jgi:hypothetical protein
VQKLVTEAPVEKMYVSKRLMYQATGKIQFPGYGMGGAGTQPAADGSVIAVVTIEIPRADKDRLLVFRVRGQACELVDDFVYSGLPGPFHIREENGQFIYNAEDGKELLRRPASAQLPR